MKKYLRFYYPLFIFIGLLCILPFIPNSMKETTVTIPKVEIPIILTCHNLRVLLVIASFLIPLIVYLFMDYSKIFPKELKMDVYLNEELIKEKLATFNRKDLAKMKIVYNETLVLKYFDSINEKINIKQSELNILLTKKNQR